MHLLKVSQPPATGRSVVNPSAASVVEHDELSLPAEFEGDEEGVGAPHLGLVVVVLGVFEAVEATLVLDKRDALDHVLKFGLENKKKYSYIQNLNWQHIITKRVNKVQCICNVLPPVQFFGRMGIFCQYSATPKYLY